MGITVTSWRSSPVYCVVGMGKRDQTPGEQLWSAFEADALPHAPSLFRLAIWFERDRAGRRYDPSFARLDALQAPSASLAGGELEIVERHACLGADETQQVAAAFAGPVSLLLARS